MGARLRPAPIPYISKKTTAVAALTGNSGGRFLPLSPLSPSLQPLTPAVPLQFPSRSPPLAPCLGLCSCPPRRLPFSAPPPAPRRRFPPNARPPAQDAAQTWPPVPRPWSLTSSVPPQFPCPAAPEVFHPISRKLSWNSRSSLVRALPVRTAQHTSQMSTVPDHKPLLFSAPGLGSREASAAALPPSQPRRP